ncbi:MAG TPA: hypothetical protein VJP80_02190 [Candidatus Saccharimonadales bacterium]|nr:hypothetical protein [Candidatus Saccharimonadales bacterium]
MRLEAASKPVSIEYPVDPAAACGGVWVERQRQFVPVTPGETIEVNDRGVRLWEYATDEGDVWACLLEVPAGAESPTWQLLQDMGESAGYREWSRTVAGSGEFRHALVAETPDTFDEIYTALPERPGEPIEAYPFNERFQVCAAPNMSIAMLTTFAVPFQNYYEAQVDHQWQGQQA